MKTEKGQKTAKILRGASKASPSRQSPPKAALNWNPVWFDLPLLVILVWAVYANGLKGEFVFDDQQIVLQNPVVQHIENLRDAIGAGGGWRQVLYLTYGLNFLWGKLDTFSYHVTNVLIHTIDVILVYFIIRRLARPQHARTAALAGSAVFAVHTLISSGVSYVTARSSTLCALFYFSAILLFLRGRSVAPFRRLREWLLPEGLSRFGLPGRSATEQPEPRVANPEGSFGRSFVQWFLQSWTGFVWFGLAGFCGLVALSTKQEAIALPVLLVGLVWLKDRDWFCATVLTAIPLTAMWLKWNEIISILHATSENKVLVAAGFDKVLPRDAYIYTYVTALFEYCLPRFLFPMALSADPHIKTVANWYSPEFIIAVLALGGLTFLMFRMAKREPLVSVGLAALLLSPLTAYVAVPLADPVLEYRLYIPALGFAILAGWAATKIPWPVVAGAVLVLAVMTVNRNMVWANAITLWEDAVLKSPGKSRTHFNLGASYQNAGRPDDAIPEYQIAMNLKRNMWAAYSNLAALKVDKGQWEEAEKLLRMATEGSPDYTEAWINLAVLHLRQGHVDDAIVAARHAVETNEGSFAGHYNLAEALTAKSGQRKTNNPDPNVASRERDLQKQDLKEAVEHYERTVYLRPDQTAFKLTLGMAYLRVGNREAGLKTWTELGEADPPKESNQTDYGVEALRKLAGEAAAQKEYDKAISLLQKALKRRPVYPDIHFEIGLNYYWQVCGTTSPCSMPMDTTSKGNHTNAMAEYKAALAQQASHGPSVLNLAMELELMGNLPEAIAVVERYLAQKPTVAPQLVGGQLDFPLQAQQRLAKLKARLEAEQKK